MRMRTSYEGDMLHIRQANISDKAKVEFTGIIAKLPLSYSNVPAIFRSLEAKTPGSGGLFSIFVSDLCTACHTELLFSYRKEDERSGRLMTGIGLRG